MNPACSTSPDPHPVPIIGHEVISASAGSGKTFQLAHRFIRLLACGVPADRVIALTFSRKAAGEIFDSVVKHLCAAASSDDHARATAGLIEIPAAGRETFLRQLRAFLDALHRVHVGTLDSFMVGIVRAFPLEVGVPADFQVLDEDGAAALELQEDVLGRIFRPGWLDPAARHDFCEGFKQSTFGTQEKSLTRALGHYLTAGREMYQVLPAENAWGDPGSIWQVPSPWLVPAGDVTAAVEGLCAWVRESDLPENVCAGFERVAQFACEYDEQTRWNEKLDNQKIFKQLLHGLDDLLQGDFEFSYGKGSHRVPAQTCRHLVVIMRHVVGGEIRRSLHQTQGIYRVLKYYEDVHGPLMRRTGRLTFRDAEALLTGGAPPGGRTLTRRQGQAGQLYIDYRLDCSLDHWLLDEFQDTSDLQWAVLRNLADEILQDDSGRRSFFYVGDVKQAIYGWRGGNARLFGRIRERYGDLISERSLDSSFRSCQAVIDTVNAVFCDLSNSGLPQGTVNDWTKVWRQHLCATGHVPQTGYVALLEPDSEGGKKKPTRQDRYRLAAAVLRQLDPPAQGLSAAVLVRSNATGREIVDLLRRECPGMPVVHEGKARLENNPVVRVLLALVRYATHPGDVYARRHLQMSPLRTEIDREDLCLSLVREIHDSGMRGLLNLWGGKLRRAGALDDYGRHRLDDLLAAAGEFDATGSRDGDSFLRFVFSYRIHESGDDDAVRVMTAHQSKGLGFDIVVLPELMGPQAMTGPRSSGLTAARDRASNLPVWTLKMPRRAIAASDPVLSGVQALADENACFEELSVLYVAMTRARQGLYMITSFPGPAAEAVTAGAFLKRRLVGNAKPVEGEEVEMEGVAAVRLYRSGRSDWYRKTARPTPVAIDRPPGIPPGYRDRVSARAKLRRVEPSAAEDSVAGAAWTFAPDARDVLDFGSAIHALFQRVEWIDDLDIEAIVADWTKTAVAGPEVRRDVVKQFRRALECDQVRRRLSRPTERVELWREKAFEIVFDQRVVSGVFDRVSILRDSDGRALAAEIIDYKSSRIESMSQQQDAVELYRPQLELYGRVLARILDLDPGKIRLTLVFTRPGRVADAGTVPGT